MIFRCFEIEENVGTEKTFEKFLVEPHVIVRAQDEAIKPLGSSVTLLCNATGNPPPVLSWSKAGQVIISSPDGVRISLTVRKIVIKLKSFRVLVWTFQDYKLMMLANLFALLKMMLVQLQIRLQLIYWVRRIKILKIINFSATTD